MFFTYYDNGGTVETLADTLEREVKWVNDRLKGRKELTLNDISDLALGMEREIRFQVRTQEATNKDPDALLCDQK